MLSIFAVFNEISVPGTYSFISNKLRVNYGIPYAYRLTAGVMKVAVGSLYKLAQILYCPI